MKGTRLAGWFLTALATALLTAFAFLVGWTASAVLIDLSGGPEGTRAASVATDSTGAPAGRDGIDLEVFWEAVSLLENHFYGEVPTEEDLTYAAIRGVVAATGDPHTSFLEPNHARLLEEDLQNEFEGIGATVDLQDDGVIIVATLPESPAERAGLLAGDVVTHVDGTSIKGKSLMEAVALIRGPRGTTVHLTVRRPNAAAPLEFDIVRDRIVLAAVESRIITTENEKSIGYLKLNDFGARAPEQVKETLEELQAQGISGLILDLRNNPGGYLSSAVNITSQFIGEGTILTEQGANDRTQVHRARPGGVALDIPLVVLINEGSASASEILAGAVQDTGRGTLVGTTTFGKGSVQVPHTLSDGSSLRVTIARWFTPNGRAIHEVGIEPDIVVNRTPEDLRTGRDPQLDRAIELLSEERP